MVPSHYVVVAWATRKMEWAWMDSMIDSSTIMRACKEGNHQPTDTAHVLSVVTMSKSS